MAAEKVDVTYNFGLRGDMAVTRQLNNFNQQLFSANDASQVLSAGLQGLAKSFGLEPVHNLTNVLKREDEKKQSKGKVSQ
jgi:hypothetical protein